MVDERTKLTQKEAMLFNLIIYFLLVSLMPSAVIDAASDAFASTEITPAGMNFDRDWASEVKLADSTVVRCIQDVWALPEVADSIHLRAIEFSSIDAVEGGVDSLISQLLETKHSVEAVLSTLPCADSLALLCTGMWAYDDSAETPGEWGILYSSRGLSIPFSAKGMEAIELDEFTDILAGWPGVYCPSAEQMIGLVMGLDLRNVHGNTQAPGVEGSVLDYSLNSEITWVIGDTGRNVYTGETRYDLIIDTGGDDLYLCGGDGIGILGTPVGLIADLAGNDTYSSSVPVCQGSGFMGYGALIDLEGDDVYRGSSMCQGSAIMGHGLFADLAGNDFMTADVHSQGAATQGSALFLDHSGDDVRRVSAYGQGFGGPGGAGDLVDCSGNDTYLAGFTYAHEPLLPNDNLSMSQGFGMGLRPFCAGGTGTLCDLGDGNDTYRTEVFGQGGGYFYSLGVLFDAGGQDTYSSAQYSQGTGIHLASGILVDVSGDDQYVSRRGPAQGGAHDLSTGFLLDLAGDDYYAAHSGQGGALNNSAAVFADCSGSDLYALKSMGHGESNWARGSAGSGLFLDLADHDSYYGAGADSTIWNREYSVGFDLSAVSPVTEDEVEEIGDPESLDMDSLFAVASEWGVSGNIERVLVHREEFASRGRGAVDYILTGHLDSWDGLEHRAVRAVFLKNRDYAVEQLLNLLQAGLEGRELSNTVQWLGEMNGEEARVELEAMLSDSLPDGMAVTLIRALGEIGSAESLSAITPFAESGSERIRRQVAVTLGEFKDIPDDILRGLQDDSSLGVRSAAGASLDRIILE